MSHANISGIIHGGPNPIQGATVRLYETQSGATANTSATSDYGSAGKLLATANATTDAFGNFNFGTPSYSCASDEYLYITATGGYTGTNASNVNSVQMATLGSCSHFDSVADEENISIYLSEISTVASAYALSRFMTVTDSGDGLQVVNVGAPLANNATAPKCSGTGDSMTCIASGLSHAFANSANLVTAVSYSGTLPSNIANVTVPGNALGNVPQSLIHLLGNIQQACVNSSGGVASDYNGANPTSCGKLFHYTIGGGVTPTNTLTAIQQMAKYPYQNISSLVALASPNSFFSPSIDVSTPPPDFSMGIFYTGTTGTGATTYNGTIATGKVAYPFSLALDAADNVYVLIGDASGPAYGGLAGMTSSGAAIFNVAPTTTYHVLSTLATDTNGIIWVPNNGGASTSGFMNGFDATSGSLTYTKLAIPNYYPQGVAVDRSNNVWYSRSQGSTATADSIGVLKISGTSSPYTYTASTYGNPGSTAMASLPKIAVSKNQDVWGTVYASSGTGTAFVVPNTSGSTASPTYAAASLKTKALGTDVNYGVFIDAYENAWYPDKASVDVVVPTKTSSVITSITDYAGGTTTSGTTAPTTVPTSGSSAPYPGEMDGANTAFWPGYASGGYIYFVPQGSTTYRSILPCYTASGATACSTSQPTTFARTTYIDSTGSVWVASGSGGTVTQIIGTAVPTWPQLSYGHPGTTVR